MRHPRAQSGQKWHTVRAEVAHSQGRSGTQSGQKWHTVRAEVVHRQGRSGTQTGQKWHTDRAEVAHRADTVRAYSQGSRTVPEVSTPSPYPTAAQCSLDSRCKFSTMEGTTDSHEAA